MLNNVTLFVVSRRLQCVQEMGNAKARRLYEAFLPKCFQRPETDQSAESFIRDKYDKKKYMDKVIDIQMLRVSTNLCLSGNKKMLLFCLFSSTACRDILEHSTCFICTERKELRQHTQGTCCV